MQASRPSGMHTLRSLHKGLSQGCDPLPVYGKIILLRLLKGEFNHENKQKFLTILTLCIALLLTACGATDAAGTDKPMSLWRKPAQYPQTAPTLHWMICISRRTRFLQIMRLYGTRYSAWWAKVMLIPAQIMLIIWLIPSKQTRTPLQRMNWKHLRTIWKPYGNRRTDNRTGTGNYRNRSYCSGKQFRSWLSLPEFLRSGFDGNSVDESLFPPMQ